MDVRIRKLIVCLCVFAFVSAVACDEPEPDDVEEVTDNDDNDNGEAGNSQLSTEYQDIRLVEEAGPFEHPWAVAFLPDGRKLVTERPGALKLVDDTEIDDIGGLPEIQAQNQGGLLDVVLHPEYEDNGWIYLTFSKPAEAGNETATALMRAQLDDEAMELVDVEELFEQDRYSSPGRHYGSRLAWMNDGTLLMSIGDRGADPPRAQDVGDHAGTVLRMNDEGSVPDDNPFVDDDEVLDEIYSYGIRNIQGMVVDPNTGEVWATDHGPRGGDLLHKIEAGNNYGWPTVTQGLNYADQGPFPHAEARSMEGVTEHVHEFFPTMAPSGLALVTTDRFRHWDDNLLAGGLRAERIRRIVLGDEDEVLHQEELLLQRVGRIRDVREGPDGDIWVLTDAGDGTLYRFEPA